ncbi:MAG: mechanosensitive ion channel [Kofleriaceae bacterium]|nr:mechanosensitive ion channel [Myxococcales bacterium]MCB9565421.1 mechanosensitive ion channel [Kofleriaceae bacterium]MCB9572838.1 mechanosensitive ion channel [Kofleriaceae bacterium]
MDLFSVEYLKHLVDVYVVPFGINLVVALLVFVFGRWLARVLVNLAKRLMARAKLEESLSKFLGDLLYAVLLMVVIIAALERLGVKTTAAVAVLGAAGLAVGFALQGSLGNFASGVMLIGFKPYKVGDVVRVAGEVGKVDSIQIFNTVLVTPDNRRIIVPNGQITGGVIENITSEPTRRVDMVFGIGYGDDMSKARDVMTGVVTAHPLVQAEPAPQIAVSELADSSVNFVVRPWCKTADYWTVKFEITEQIKRALDDAGISIPFPQRDVHLYQQKAA